MVHLQNNNPLLYTVEVDINHFEYPRRSLQVLDVEQLRLVFKNVTDFNI